MDFGRLDLNLLRVLNVLLHERSVTRAAERLNVTQQAVSNSLRKLRQELDDPLLVRVGHRMRLTLLDASLLEPLRDALLELETALRQRPSFDPATTARTFSIAMPHYHSFVLLPRALRVLAAEAPLINLQVQVPTLVDSAALERGDIDLIAVEDAHDHTVDDRLGGTVRRQVLLSDDFVCVIGDTAANSIAPLTAERYVAAAHCVMRPRPADRMQVERGWTRLGILPRVAAVAPGYAVMLLTLPGTGLVATVPRRIADVFAPMLRLRLQECPVPLEQQRAELLWHQRDDNEPEHTYLRSILRRVAADDQVGMRATLSGDDALP